MLKAKAIELLGGTVSSAAQAIGISYQAVDKWPDVLPDRITDRVLAVLARRHLTPTQLGLDKWPEQAPTASEAAMNPAPEAA